MAEGDTKYYTIKVKMTKDDDGEHKIDGVKYSMNARYAEGECTADDSAYKDLIKTDGGSSKRKTSKRVGGRTNKTAPSKKRGSSKKSSTKKAQSKK